MNRITKYENQRIIILLYLKENQIMVTAIYIELPNITRKC